jgi:hypothetical protein
VLFSYSARAGKLLALYNRSPMALRLPDCFLTTWLFIAGHLFTISASAQKLFSGTFEGTAANGALIQLELNNKNNQITGRYSETENSEADYNIVGTVEGKIIKGKMISVSNTALFFKITCQATEEGIHFSLDNPLWASIIPAIDFKKSIPNNTVNDNSRSSGFDTRLTGKWVSTEYEPSSGDFRGVYSQTMIIRNNAEATFYESTFSGNTSSGSVQSSPGKIAAQIKIITRDKKIYGIQKQSGKEIFIADYVVDATRLITIGTDLKKQFWTRQ